MELLTNFKQTNATRISDHIHEWRHRRRMVKIFVPNQPLAEWFIKSLLPSIAEDVAKGGVITEEQVISRAQCLDLIYTQFGTLYEKISNTSRSNFTVPPPSKDFHIGDGLIGIASTHHTTTFYPSPSSEINVVSFEKGKSDKHPRSEKKGKSKKNQTSNPQEKSSDQSSGNRKPRLSMHNL